MGFMAFPTFDGKRNPRNPASLHGITSPFSAPIQTWLHLFLQDAEGRGSGFVICPVIKEQNCKLSNERCKEEKKKGGSGDAAVISRVKYGVVLL